MMIDITSTFEPGIAEAAKKYRSEVLTEAATIATISAAISLKRIADALTGNDPGVVDVFHDFWMEAGKDAHALDVLMENAGYAFKVGMNGRG
jgi:hypothetical protein